jgi:hypothetical protein
MRECAALHSPFRLLGSQGLRGVYPGHENRTQKEGTFTAVKAEKSGGNQAEQDASHIAKALGFFVR